LARQDPKQNLFSSCSSEKSIPKLYIAAKFGNHYAGVVISPAIGRLLCDVTISAGFSFGVYTLQFSCKSADSGFLNVNLLSAVRKYFVFHKQGYTLTTFWNRVFFNHFCSGVGLSKRNKDNFFGLNLEYV